MENFYASLIFVGEAQHHDSVDDFFRFFVLDVAVFVEDEVLEIPVESSVVYDGCVAHDDVFPHDDAFVVEEFVELRV